MSAAYWLGVVTIPALVLLFVVAVRTQWWITRTLDERYGIKVQSRIRRKVDEISDYTLRNSIWWERSFGPVFVGGWCREDYRAGGDAVTRWIGIGSVDGPCLMVLRKQAVNP